MKIKSGRNYLILDSTKYLDEDLEVLGECMEPRDPRNFVKLAKVLPIVNIVDRYDAIGKGEFYTQMIPMTKMIDHDRYTRVKLD